MNFKVVFYRKYSFGLVDYTDIPNDGISFIDQIKEDEPSYKNLSHKDIVYTGYGSTISNRYELELTIDQARESGHFSKCTEISVAVDGLLNDFCIYLIEERWTDNFFLPFFKRLEGVDVKIGIDDDLLYSSWKAAGFPKSWKI